MFSNILTSFSFYTPLLQLLACQPLYLVDCNIGSNLNSCLGLYIQSGMPGVLQYQGSGEGEGFWRKSTSGEVSGVVCVELYALLVREERDARAMEMVGARRRL